MTDGRQYESVQAEWRGDEFQVRDLALGARITESYVGQGLAKRPPPISLRILMTDKFCYQS
jgi:hypothetical protein